TRIAKKAITPKQKKVTVLSSVGPARPTPLSAIAAGAARRDRAQIESRATAVRFTGGNLAYGSGISASLPQIRLLIVVKILLMQEVLPSFAIQFPRLAGGDATHPNRRCRIVNSQQTIRLAVVDSDSGFLTVLSKRAEAAGWQLRLFGSAIPPEELVA